jgi:hypothetical protein
MIPVFLCRKSAEFGAAETFSGKSFAVDSAGAGQAAAASKFRELYRARTGANPGIAANEIYLAVRMVATALRATGPNRIILRDYLANQGISREREIVTPFDPAGNDLRKPTLVKLQTNNQAKP